MPTVNGASASITPITQFCHSKPSALGNSAELQQVSKLASVFTAFAAFVIMSPSAEAALMFSSGYGSTLFFTHSNSDNINSYDWGSDGNLYYATAKSDFTSGGVYRYDGTNLTTIRSASSDFSGASVVAINSSIYFNDSNFPGPKIYRYNINDSSTTSLTTNNYSLTTDGVNLLTTGSGATQFNYYANGILSGALDLGGVAGASGPAAFDMAGNLFYAPGFGDPSIYRWTAVEVAAAVLGGGASPLEGTGHLWTSTSGVFTGGGASSIAFDEAGKGYITFTNFVDSSALVSFNADGSGSFEEILTSNGRIGDLRVNGGNLFLASNNQIITIIPEPSTMLIALSGLGLLLRKKR